MKQFILLLTIALLTGCFGSDPQKSGKEGKPLPDFSILLTDSTTLLHSRNIPAGKPVVIFYLNPYCPYCKAQTKEIIEDMDRLQDINFYFISNYPLAAVKGFYMENQLKKYPNIVVGLDTALTVGNYFEIAGVPYLAIYGKNKTLNKTFMGKIYSSQLKNVTEE